MPSLAEQDNAGARAPSCDGGRRSIVLGTLSVRFDPEAERFALDSALHAHAALIVTNVVEFKPYACTMALLGPSAATLPDEEDLEPVRETAYRAASLGLHVELLRVTSSRPVRALLEIVHERDAGLLVFGPDPRRMRRRVWRRAVAQIRDHADCLVWIALPTHEPHPWHLPTAQPRAHRTRRT
jgi:nucleotide-binding universal stress UspA family protein